VLATGHEKLPRHRCTEATNRRRVFPDVASERQ
jgi:hypothetical protein